MSFLGLLLLAGTVYAGSVEVGPIEPPTKLEKIKLMLDYAIWNPRINAVYDLGELGEEALPLLIYADDDADWQVRMTAVHFLGKKGPGATEALYEVAKREPCPHVRLLALRGLSRLGREGQALYRETVTPEDERDLARLPKTNLGKSVVIDTPQGDMTKEFFDGVFVDPRVCASSERAGRLRKHLKWPRGKKKETWSNEIVVTPEVTVGRDLKREAFEREEREYLERERRSSREEKKTKAELDDLFASTERDGVEPRGPEAPGDPGQTNAERMPRNAGGFGERVVEKGAVSFAAIERPGISSKRIEEPLKKSAAVAEAFPAAPAGIFHEGPEAGEARIVADKGTGKQEYDPIPDLLRQLRAVEPRKRARAADELGKRGKAALRAVPLLTKALKDKDRRVRASAVLALGSIGDPASAKDLKRALRDKDEDVRFSAMTALRRVTAER